MKKAFTLAEVLVTLGIIGVVSAMTVPTLMRNHQKKTYITQLHKVYNEITQALIQYRTDRNALNLKEAGFTSTASVQTFIKTYLKTINECDKVGSPCFADEYKTLSGTAPEGWTIDTKSYVLPSGAAIRPAFSVSGDKLVHLLVDINGQQGPNILGRDIFFMAIYNNCVLDSVATGATSAPLTDAQRDSINSDNWKPFAQILNDNWEMNY